MDLMTAIAAATKSLEALKSVREISKDFDAAAFKAKIAELMSDVADMKIALIEVKDELAAKDKEIDRLKAAFSRRETETVEVYGFRYEKSGHGEPMGAPFCPRCETVSGVLMHLADVRKKDMGSIMTCPNCKAEYGRVSCYTYPDR